MSIKVLDNQGSSTKPLNVSLPNCVTKIEVKSHDLLEQVYLAHQANSRTVIANTKKRGEVSGGGKKPWRQKGTGRARFGSSRNPIWKGGGVAFGPSTERNFTQKINQRSKKQALKMALKMADDANRICYVSSIKLSGKSKDAAQFINKTKFPIGLIVVSEITKELMLSFRNFQDIELIRADKISAYDVLNHGQILIVGDGLEILKTRLEQK